LKQGNALTPLLFNVDLEYVISKAQETWEAMKLNGSYPFLIYADIFKSFVVNINTIKNRDSKLDASRTVNVEVKAEKDEVLTDISSPECRTKL
jgi:hypothetical protein